MSDFFCPSWCVRSGDFFGFFCDKSPEEVAKQYVFAIMRVKGGTLGPEIIVQEDYQGKVAAIFDTEEFLNKIRSGNEFLGSKIKFEISEVNLVTFSKAPFGRRSGDDDWQNFYWIHEPMFDAGNGRWIAQGFRMNPFEKVAIYRMTRPVTDKLRYEYFSKGLLKKYFDHFAISRLGQENPRAKKSEKQNLCVLVCLKKRIAAASKIPRQVDGMRIFVRVFDSVTA